MTANTRPLWFYNVKMRLLRRPFRFYQASDHDLYFVVDGDRKHFFGNKSRGYRLYGRGLDYRANTLFNSYLLNKIEFSHDDIVIDCGANYADLLLTLKKYISEENYISFEPGKEEHKAIIMNAPNSQNFNLGLSNKIGEQEFFLSSKGGDSSAIEPKEFTKIIKCSFTTLDAFMEENKLKKVKLLKLEAEGFEPEILEGATKFFQICEYISVDGGPERGIEMQATLDTATKILTENNFRKLTSNSKSKALFYNTVIAD